MPTNKIPKILNHPAKTRKLAALRQCESLHAGFCFGFFTAFFRAGIPKLLALKERRKKTPLSSQRLVREWRPTPVLST
ncbi:MAG: hypothetical protein H7A32_02375 [Deltaproteobacteria bacterium]|nr:hypothetical protein [Deltaproteobacteria bacterium]